QLVALGAIPERDRPRLVLTDGLQHLAEGRVNRAVDQKEPGQEHREYDEIERQRVLQIEESQERAARHRLDAVLAAGEGGLQAEEVQHLRERPRDVRGVAALA